MKITNDSIDRLVTQLTHKMMIELTPHLKKQEDGENHYQAAVLIVHQMFTQVLDPLRRKP